MGRYTQKGYNYKSQQIIKAGGRANALPLVVKNPRRIMYFNEDEFFDFDIIETNETYVPEGEKECSCCFTGHRRLMAKEKKDALIKLRSTILYLVSKGVYIFRAGGALGFDTLAASMVIDLKREHSEIKLVLELPYEAQHAKWSDKDKRIFEFIKENADFLNVHSAVPKNKNQAVEAMYKRNRALVDNSSYCICFMNKNSGGTAYTTAYAKKKDIEIINLAFI